jgi:hypothetical protein
VNRCYLWRSFEVIEVEGFRICNLLHVDRTLNLQGYSALAVALVLPDSGLLVACDRSEKSLAVAETYFKRAGVSHKVY